MRKQGIILKQVAYTSLPDRQIYTCFRIEQHSASKIYHADVGSFYPCNTLQCHGFATSRSSKQSKDFAVGFKINFKIKIFKFLFYVHIKLHLLNPLLLYMRSFQIFIRKIIVNDIAIIINTHT